jgi:hypothetical protein
MILGFLRQLTIAVACTTGQSAVAAPTFTLSRGCRPTNTPHCAHASHAAAVRCCTASGHRHNKCISVCQPTAGRSAGTAPRLCTNGFASNWSEASSECAAHSATLCTHMELAACCKTGCAMDKLPTWTLDHCGSTRAEVALPRINYHPSRRNGATCSTHKIANHSAFEAPALGSRTGCGSALDLTAQVAEVVPPPSGSKWHRQALRVLTEIILPRRASSTWNIYCARYSICCIVISTYISATTSLHLYCISYLLHFSYLSRSVYKPRPPRRLYPAQQFGVEDDDEIYTWGIAILLL